MQTSKVNFSSDSLLKTFKRFPAATVAPQQYAPQYRPQIQQYQPPQQDSYEAEPSMLDTAVKYSGIATLLALPFVGIFIGKMNKKAAETIATASQETAKKLMEAVSKNSTELAETVSKAAGKAATEGVTGVLTDAKFTRQISESIAKATKPLSDKAMLFMAALGGSAAGAGAAAVTIPESLKNDKDVETIKKATAALVGVRPKFIDNDLPPSTLIINDREIKGFNNAKGLSTETINKINREVGMSLTSAVNPKQVDPKDAKLWSVAYETPFTVVGGEADIAEQAPEAYRKAGIDTYAVAPLFDAVYNDKNHYGGPANGRTFAKDPDFNDDGIHFIYQTESMSTPIKLCKIYEGDTNNGNKLNYDFEGYNVRYPDNVPEDQKRTTFLHRNKPSGDIRFEVYEGTFKGQKYLLVKDNFYFDYKNEKLINGDTGTVYGNISGSGERARMAQFNNIMYETLAAVKEGKIATIKRSDEGFMLNNEGKPIDENGNVLQTDENGKVKKDAKNKPMQVEGAAKSGPVIDGEKKLEKPTSMVAHEAWQSGGLLAKMKMLSYAEEADNVRDKETTAYLRELANATAVPIHNLGNGFQGQLWAGTYVAPNGDPIYHNPPGSLAIAEFYNNIFGPYSAAMAQHVKLTGASALSDELKGPVGFMSNLCLNPAEMAVILANRIGSVSAGYLEEITNPKISLAGSLMAPILRAKSKDALTSFPNGVDKVKDAATLANVNALNNNLRDSEIANADPKDIIKITTMAGVTWTDNEKQILTKLSEAFKALHAAEKAEIEKKKEGKYTTVKDFVCPEKDSEGKSKSKPGYDDKFESVYKKVNYFKPYLENPKNGELIKKLSGETAISNFSNTKLINKKIFVNLLLDSINEKNYSPLFGGTPNYFGLTPDMDAEGKKIVKMRNDQEVKDFKNKFAGISEKTPIFSMASRLNPQKGFDTATAAYGKLLDKIAEENKKRDDKNQLEIPILIMSGGGISERDEKDGYQQRVTKLVKDVLKKHPEARILWARNRATGLLGMNMTTTNIMPSDFEPFGISDLKGMYAGSHVIVTEVGGMRPSLTPKDKADEEKLKNGTAKQEVIDAVENFTSRKVYPAEFKINADGKYELTNNTDEYKNKHKQNGPNALTVKDYEFMISVDDEYANKYRKEHKLDGNYDINKLVSELQDGRMDRNAQKLADAMFIDMNLDEKTQVELDINAINTDVSWKNGATQNYLNALNIKPTEEKK